MSITSKLSFFLLNFQVKIENPQDLVLGIPETSYDKMSPGFLSQSNIWLLNVTQKPGCILFTTNQCPCIFLPIQIGQHEFFVTTGVWQ